MGPRVSSPAAARSGLQLFRCKHCLKLSLVWMLFAHQSSSVRLLWSGCNSKHILHNMSYYSEMHHTFVWQLIADVMRNGMDEPVPRSYVEWLCFSLTCRKCAMISAHYGMSDVFDNLVISLCKFTTLLSAPEVSPHVCVIMRFHMSKWRPCHCHEADSVTFECEMLRKYLTSAVYCLCSMHESKKHFLDK